MNIIRLGKVILVIITMVIWTGCNSIGEDNGDDIYINKPEFISTQIMQ
jgi:hypothetical protein